MRAVVAVLLVAAAASPAVAQPANPYDTGPVGAPGAVMDPALAESVAMSVVTRAQELFDAKLYPDAKQLAVEALATSGGSGPSADKARALIHAVNVQLGLPDDQPKPPPTPPPIPQPIDTSPIIDPVHGDLGLGIDKHPIDRPVTGNGRMAARIHAGLYGAVLGATIGTAFSSDPGSQVGPSIGLGAAGAAGASLFLAPVLDRHFSEAQIRTMGSMSNWGAVIGGLMADSTTGVGNDGSSTSGRQVLIGASIGATVGAGVGYAIASQDKLTTGDVALIDTMAGIGAVGGLTLGMLMQPAQSEGYDVNAMLGAAGGIVIGLVYAPQTNTTPRRMARVAGIAAAGAAIPFLFYAAIYDSSTNSDERLVGLLSTTGLLAGTYYGFKWTSKMDVGKDVKVTPGKPLPKEDAPPAVIGRASDGQWGMNGVGALPLSRALDNHQHGMTFTVLGGSF